MKPWHKLQRCGVCRNRTMISVTQARDVIHESGALLGEAMDALSNDLQLSYREMYGDTWVCLTCGEVERDNDL